MVLDPTLSPGDLGHIDAHEEIAAMLGAGGTVTGDKTFSGAVTFTGAAKFKGHPWHDVTTESGVDPTGVAPSQTGLQTVLNASKRVYFSAGTYHLTAGLTIPADRIIEFAPDAEITVPAGGAFDVLVADGVADVTVRRPRIRKLAGADYASSKAGIAVRGNAADVHIEDSDVDGLGRGFDLAGVLGAAVAGVTRRVTLSDCTARNSVNYGCVLEDCDVVELDNFRSLTSGLDGIKIRKSARNWRINGGYGTGATGGDGIDAFAGGSEFVIDGFIADANGLNGIVIKSSTYNAIYAFTVVAATDLFTVTDHGYSAGDEVTFSNLVGSAGITAGPSYFIRDVTTNTFKVAATSGGAAIDITSDGSGNVKGTGYGFVRLGIIDNVRCTNNGGIGLSIHRHSGESGDNTAQPLPAHIAVGTVIADTNGNSGVYLRARSVLIGQVIARNNGKHGIEIDEACFDIDITQATVIGNGTVTAASDGIRISGGSRITIGRVSAIGADTGNVRSDADLAALTPTQRYGVRVEAVTTAYVLGGISGAYNTTGLFSLASAAGWFLPGTDPTSSKLSIPNDNALQLIESGGTFRDVLKMSTGNVIQIGNSNVAQVSALGSSFWRFFAEVRIDGAFNHDGTTVGFYGVTPVARSAAYTPTNVTTARTYDANATTLDELADILGTLIADLRATGIIG